VATTTPAQNSKAAAPSGSAPGTYAHALAAPTPPPLLALTQDPRFLVTLRKVSGPAHPVRVAASEIDFSAQLLAHQAGVAVIDSAAVVSGVGRLTQKLHVQFPEVVLIVAGTSGEQGELAAQIADGSVHRFLAKPVSEQRVRLFVEAAWRRQLETRDTVAVPRAGGPRTLRWALIAAAVAALAAGGAWLALRHPAPAPAAAGPQGGNASASAQAASDPVLEELLTRAAHALAAGALVAPPAENAADLYREALKRNARDPRAANGLEQVIDRLLTEADAQLQDHHLDAAEQFVDAARAINASHPRVAFLGAQVGAQRERAVLGKAQRAAAGGDVAAALAVLDDAARGGHRSSLVDEARTQLAQKQVDEHVTDFLARARAALAAGALLEPPEQNARFYVESARALAPNDANVQQARQEFIARLEGEAHQALAAANAEQTDKWADAAREAGADAADVAALHASAQQLRGGARADPVARLDALFKERLAQGHLVEPPADSARAYLEQLAQAEPAGAATLAARGALEARLLEEARTALKDNNTGATRRWLGEARTLGASPAAISALEAELNAAANPSRPAVAAPAAAGTAGTAGAPTASAAPAAGASSLGAAGAASPENGGSADLGFVNASALTRTRYVPPQYPANARERGLEGWVDLQFMVMTDGSLADVAIVGAQPVGVFEQAALEAVRRWHYQPVVQGGAPVMQRARLRVRFAVQP
jgi:protein TonB